MTSCHTAPQSVAVIAEEDTLHTYMQARSLIRDSRLDKLLQADELVSMVHSGRAFNGWTEGHITFPPTFKYAHA